MKKVFGGISGSMALLLIIGFFLPWIEVSCAKMPLVEQTGMQVVLGDAQPSPSMQKMSEGMGGEKSEAPGGDAAKNTSGALWLILVALGGIAAGVGGFLALAKKNTGVLVTVGSGIAILVLGGTMLIGFPMENEIKAEMDKKLAESKKEDGGNEAIGAQMGASIIQVNYKVGLWMVLLAVAVQLGSGFVLIFTGKPTTAALPQPPRRGGPRTGKGLQPYGNLAGSNLGAVDGQALPQNGARPTLPQRGGPAIPQPQQVLPMNDSRSSPKEMALEVLALAVGLDGSKIPERQKRALAGAVKLFGPDIKMAFTTILRQVQPDPSGAQRLQTLIAPIAASGDARLSVNVVKVSQYILKDADGLAPVSSEFLRVLETGLNGGI
ncbi:hypothetical protein OAU50_05490 [Planctomycetota bacterium]|nr:hypothetical protein [Planctomycetota bacterium]